MLTSDARVVRGLSIANIVLSSLAIVGAIIILGITAFAVMTLNDPSFGAVVEGSLSPSELRDLETSGLSSAEALALSAGIVGIGGAAAGIWTLICGVLNLIASIFNLRSCSRPEALKSSFVWAIVGAVAAFLRGALITTVLFIIAAVYLNKLKKANDTAAYAYGQPQGFAAPQNFAGAGAPQAYGQQPQGYTNQQAYGQPQNFAQPQSPSAPEPYGQPVAYAQPEASQPAPYGQPQQPATPAANEAAAPEPYGQPQQPAASQQPASEPEQK